MTTTEQHKKLVIFGSGGHGWKSIKKVIDSFDGEVTITMLPVDWGGSTGTIGRLFKMRNGNLNKKLHGTTSFPVLPFGDINKFIASYVEDSFENSVTLEYKGKVINCFEFRSDSYSALIREFGKIVKALKVSPELELSFYDYLKKYLDYYLEFKDYLSNPKTTSLGNIWHAFLFYTFNGANGLVDYYKSKKVIPQNFKLIFVSDDREVLEGSYTNEYNKNFKLSGEDMVDTSHYPIDPESLKLVHTIEGQEIVSKKFVNELEGDSIIIIPNGSLANWLPLINIEKIAKILEKKSKEGKLIWVMNLFHSKNEYPFDVYYHYLSGFNITPVILCPISIPSRYYVSFLKDYQKEGKTLNYNFNTQPHTSRDLKIGFNNCLEVITNLDDLNVEGLKYRRESIRLAVHKYLSV